ncbi:hypothetical protein OEZ86_006486 [Tetradesmus obliquus]|nr:hypothetical protein OEZ86_006486 [Tetradesmus obliquus]
MAGGRVQEVHSAAEWNAVKNGGGGSFGSANAVVVDFSATWCGPCQQIGPIFEKLSLQYPAVTFVKIDVDECQDVAGECGVRAMPTFQAFFNGAKVDELTGADPGRLQAMIAKLNEKASSSTGTGQKVGGAAASSSAAAPAPGTDDMRARLAAAAEARLKAIGQ